MVKFLSYRYSFVRDILIENVGGNQNEADPVELRINNKQKNTLPVFRG
jgi:hypothetical protein